MNYLPWLQDGFPSLLRRSPAEQALRLPPEHRTAPPGAPEEAHVQQGVEGEGTAHGRLHPHQRQDA